MLTRAVASSWSSACSTSRMVPVRPMPALRGRRGGRGQNGTRGCVTYRICVKRTRFAVSGIKESIFSKQTRSVVLGTKKKETYQADEVCRVRNKGEKIQMKRTKGSDTEREIEMEIERERGGESR